jgi:D-alanyl-D-alanine carboxypeptidase/D-alanyl-D-alanine-endopeptidase (penicillin-binding protein 4)
VSAFRGLVWGLVCGLAGLVAAVLPLAAPAASTNVATATPASSTTQALGIAPASESLPEPLARIARQLGVPATGISLLVQGIGDPAPRVAYQADVPRNPASTLKLVTTFAALERLGPSHVWTTEVHATRVPGADDTVGDLFIRGGGDPYLVQEEFWKLLAALRHRGIRRIEGDLVFDLSRFDLPPEDRGAFDGQPDRVYNALPHALLVNFNAVSFRVEALPGGLTRVTADPPLPNLVVQNRLRSVPGACGGYQLGVGISIQDAAERNRAALDGRFPAVCGEHELARSVLTPETYAYGLFALYWRQLGGEISGRWRLGTVPPGSTPVHVHRSPPLGDVIRLVNKFSNNVMTRQLEYALAVEEFGVPATPEKGERALLQTLAAEGVDTRGLVIRNSAGLARETRITARQLAAVLEAGWNSPWMSEYVSSLALAGLDGTMRYRLRGDAAQGRLHLKTGRLNGVSAVAGYVDAASGQRLLVVLFVNAEQAHLGPGEELQNAFLEWVYRAH